jgi:hypothetical protein
MLDHKIEHCVLLPVRKPDIRRGFTENVGERPVASRNTSFAPRTANLA